MREFHHVVLRTRGALAGQVGRKNWFSVSRQNINQAVRHYFPGCAHVQSAGTPIFFLTLNSPMLSFYDFQEEFDHILFIEGRPNEMKQ